MKWGALAFATALAATALVSSAGAAQQSASSAAANLSTRAAATSYLVSLGINPKGVVIQRGARNYAGPNCPGKGWTCTTSTRVLQISLGGQRNLAACDQDCEIVQTTSEGDNNANCSESSSDANANQDCDIFQTNTSSTGSNFVGVTQQVETGAEGNSSQNVVQETSIKQESKGGSNDASVIQSLSETTSGGTNQSQDGAQSLAISQKSTTGDNHAGNADTAIGQSLSESASAFANDGQAITQDQNTQATSPNTNTGITQTSDSGANFIVLNQSHDLSENASGSARSVEQNQGNPNGGLNSVVNQNSSGVSRFSNDQNENQNANTDVSETVPVTHTQYGPMWSDPQQGNPSDTTNLTQNSNQNGDGSGLQNDQAYAYCDSAGQCVVGEGITQNDNGFGNSCGPAPSCHIGLIVINQQDVRCSADCPPQPPAPLVESPSGSPGCALIGTNPGPPKQIMIQVQDSQGVQDIEVAPIDNATYTIDPPNYTGSTDPIVVTATKTDQGKSSFIRLTITNSAGVSTVCDPIIPAVLAKKHKQVARKAKSHRASSLVFRVDASRLVYGQPKPLTITGSVPSGKAGEHVALLSTTCGFKGAAHLATLTTGPGGVFRYRYAPAINASFAVRWNNLTSAGKPVRVQPAIALRKAGHGVYRIDVSTTNGVFLAGTKVTLEALAGGRWTPLGQAVLAKNSPIDVMTAVSSATIAKTAAGKKLRARVPATACYSPAASATIGG